MPPGMTVLQSEVAGNVTKRDGELHGTGLRPLLRWPTQTHKHKNKKAPGRMGSSFHGRGVGGRLPALFASPIGVIFPSPLLGHPGQLFARLRALKLSWMTAGDRERMGTEGTPRSLGGVPRYRRAASSPARVPFSSASYA